MQLGRRDRAVQARAHEEVANVRVGLEQHRRRKQHVVDADDAVFVQLDVVDEGRSSVQREVQRVVQIVIEVGAGADDEVDEPALHQLDHAAAKTGRRQRAGNRQRDGRVVLGQQHLVGEDAAGLTEPRGVEGLKAFVDEVPDVGAAAGPVVPDGLAAQVVGSGFFWCTGRTVGHQRCSLAPPHRLGSGCARCRSPARSADNQTSPLKRQSCRTDMSVATNRAPGSQARFDGRRRGAIPYPRPVAAARRPAALPERASRRALRSRSR